MVRRSGEQLLRATGALPYGFVEIDEFVPTIRSPLFWGNHVHFPIRDALVLERTISSVGLDVFHELNNQGSSEAT